MKQLLNNDMELGNLAMQCHRSSIEKLNQYKQNMSDEMEELLERKFLQTQLEYNFCMEVNLVVIAVLYINTVNELQKGAGSFESIGNMCQYINIGFFTRPEACVVQLIVSHFFTVLAGSNSSFVSLGLILF
jgi:hypothetical protein